MERSVFSDFVFVNAMRSKNLLSRQCLFTFFNFVHIGSHFIINRKSYVAVFRFYHHFRNMLMNEIALWPHLCIYLDTNVDACLENIKKRGKVVVVFLPFDYMHEFGCSRRR